MSTSKHTSGSAKYMEIDLTPETQVWTNHGQTGAPPHVAIAEFIDNSVDNAVKNNKKVNVSIQYTVLGSMVDSIRIQDNAGGMNFEQLSKALKMGSSDKPQNGKQIGRFGMGMKTSLASFGGDFEIYTNTENCQYTNMVSIKLSELKEWKAKNFHIPKKVTSGTILFIKNCKPINAVNFHRNLMTNLPHTFRNYLKDGTLNLTINGFDVEFKDVELINEPGARMEIKIKANNYEVNGWVGLRKSVSGGQDEYGFDLVKNGRTITPFSKIGFGNDPVFNRVVGELNFDNFPTDYHKRFFDEALPEWDIIAKTLAKQIKPLLQKAREINDSNSKKVDRIVEKAIPELLKKLSNLLMMDENLKNLLGEGNSGDTSGVAGRPSPKRSEVNVKDGEKKDHTAKNISTPRKAKVSKVGGLNVSHEIKSVGEEAPKKFWSIEDGIMVITTNQDHPSYPLESAKRQRHAMINIIECISHQMANEQERMDSADNESSASIDKYNEILDAVHRAAIKNGLIGA